MSEGLSVVDLSATVKVDVLQMLADPTRNDNNESSMHRRPSVAGARTRNVEGQCAVNLGSPNAHEQAQYPQRPLVADLPAILKVNVL